MSFSLKEGIVYVAVGVGIACSAFASWQITQDNFIREADKALVAQRQKVQSLTQYNDELERSVRLQNEKINQQQYKMFILEQKAHTHENFSPLQP